MKTLVDLTDRLPFKLDLPKLQEEVRMLEAKHSWVGHYDPSLADGWTAVPLVSHDGTMDRVDSQRVGKWGQYQRTAICEKLPYTSHLLDSLKCPHGRIRIMRMEPGTIIRPHRDVFEEVANYAFDQVRLHIPVFTSPKVAFVVGGKPLHLQEGRMYYVNFSKSHYVRNDGTEMRTHLVMDVKINDWLRNVFPPESLTGRVANLVERNTLPAAWYMGSAREFSRKIFWSLYEDSWVQNVRHRMRARRPA